MGGCCGCAVWRCRRVAPAFSPGVCVLQGIFHFQLGRGEPMLHTRVRPHCREFLEKIARLYELHVFTFGSRLYAHTIAGGWLGPRSPRPSSALLNVVHSGFALPLTFSDTLKDGGGNPAFLDSIASQSWLLLPQMHGPLPLWAGAHCRPV